MGRGLLTKNFGIGFIVRLGGHFVLRNFSFRRKLNQLYWCTVVYHHSRTNAFGW